MYLEGISILIAHVTCLPGRFDTEKRMINTTGTGNDYSLETKTVILLLIPIL